MADDPSSTLSIDAPQVLRLIQAYLTESGLHESCRALRLESGVGAAGLLTHSSLIQWCKSGQWGKVLETLSSLQQEVVSSQIWQKVYTITILELGHLGEYELAHSVLRLGTETLNHEFKAQGELDISPSRVMEQRLAALMALRAQHSNNSLLTDDYYGTASRQNLRDDVASLVESIPILPPRRFTTLLQQAIKWQSHTGQLPTVTTKSNEEEEEKDQPKKKKQRFDLVLGNVDIATRDVVDKTHLEPIVGKLYSKIKFGKHATAECAAFLPDGSGLVTGSSDGIVEIWDANHKFHKLNRNLEYQKSDDNLAIYHEDAVTALTISNDGTLLATASTEIKIWSLSSGQCLREIQAAHTKTISSLDFTPDGSKLLSAAAEDVREFGLRTSKMLKEFRGHASFVNKCMYATPETIVTASADGTVRVWNYVSMEVLHVMQPSLHQASICIQTNTTNLVDAVNIHSVCKLHTPPDTLIVVPRANYALHVSLDGKVLHTFTATETIVAATISPANTWLYALCESGTANVYDIGTGKLEKQLADFGNKDWTTLIHHPHKSVVGGFSNDKGQKRGTLTLWKK